VTIQSSNDYGTVMIVSLDNQPLTESKRVLVQVGTTARPTGWIERQTTFQGDDGKQTYHGKQVVDTSLSIRSPESSQSSSRPTMASRSSIRARCPGP